MKERHMKGEDAMREWWECKRARRMRAGTDAGKEKVLCACGV